MITETYHKLSLKPIPHAMLHPKLALSYCICFLVPSDFFWTTSKNYLRPSGGRKAIFHWLFYWRYFRFSWWQVTFPNCSLASLAFSGRKAVTDVSAQAGLDLLSWSQLITKQEKILCWMKGFILQSFIFFSIGYLRICVVKGFTSPYSSCWRLWKFKICPRLH